MNTDLIPVYVVSLCDSTRRLDIGKHLQEHNIQFEFIDAVLGANVPPERIFDINNSFGVRSKYKREITANELGCSFSHLSVYNKMLKEGTNWAIILEDDVVLDCNVQRLLSERINSFSPDNLYLLGAQDGLCSQSFVITSHFSKIHLLDDFVFNKTICSSRYVFRTAAYFLHINVAKKILELSQENYYLADDWLNFKRKKAFKKIFLADIAHHPIVSSEQSLIEAQRKLTQPENIFRNKIKNSKIWSATKYIEKQVRCLLRLFL